MSNIQILDGMWPIVVTMFGATFWLARLESKVNALDTAQIDTKGELDELRAKHEALVSKTLQELGKIREALARIEGRLSVTNEEG